MLKIVSLNMILHSRSTLVIMTWRWEYAMLTNIHFPKQNMCIYDS